MSGRSRPRQTSRRRRGEHEVAKEIARHAIPAGIVSDRRRSLRSRYGQGTLNDPIGTRATSGRFSPGKCSLLDRRTNTRTQTRSCRPGRGPCSAVSRRRRRPIRSTSGRIGTTFHSDRPAEPTAASNPNRRTLLMARQAVSPDRWPCASKMTSVKSPELAGRFSATDLHRHTRARSNPNRRGETCCRVEPR